MLATALKSLETEPGEILTLLSNDSDRVDLAQLSEDPVFPRIVNVPVVDMPDGVTHSGEDNAYVARWQVDAYAQDFDTADRLARAIWTKFTKINSRPVASVTITSCRRTNMTFYHETALDKWRFLIEFEFRYNYHNMP